MTRRFRRRGATVVATLGATEAQVLRVLAMDLRAFLDDPAPKADDPVRSRLYPRAYLDPTEEVAEAEWQGLVHSDLAEGRRRAIGALESTLDRAAPRRGDRVEIALDEDEAAAWLGVMNDVRLAFGTRLEVAEDLDPADIPTDHPEGQAYAVYWWLGALQEDLIATIAPA